MTLLLLLPAFLDSLRVTLGVRFMSNYAVSGCLVLWMLRILRERRMGFQWSPVYLPLLLLAGAAFLSVTSPIGSPMGKLYRAFSFSYTRLFMVVLIINLLRTRGQLRGMLDGFIGLATGSALIALWQYGMYQSAGVIRSFAQGEQVFRITLHGTFLRATGLAVDPNEIGILMAVAAVSGLAFALYGEGMGMLRRVRYLLLFPLLAAGVVVTFSRSALLSLVLLSLAAPLLVPHGRIVSLTLLYAACGLTLWLSGQFRNILDLVGDPTGDVSFRLDANWLGIQALAEFPLTGVGVDSFTSYDNPFELPVHNLFIQMGSEMGVPGLLFFCILVLYQSVRLLWAAWATRDAEVRAILAALTLGYFTKILAHLSNPILTDLSFWFLVGAVERGVLLGEAGPPGRRDREEDGGREAGLAGERVG